MREPMTIGDLSRATDCKIETIRYYEKIGMLPEPRRTEGGHRLYKEEHYMRLGFIRRARSLGFTLNDIRNLLTLSEGKKTSCGKVRGVAQMHLEDVRSRIKDLKAMEQVLQDLVDKCKGRKVPACPIIESLSQEALVSTTPQEKKPLPEEPVAAEGLRDSKEIF